MGNVRTRTDTGNLFFDFRYRGVRCREQTTLADTPANRKRMQGVLDKIEAEITLGTFDYLKYFPSGRLAAKFAGASSPATVVRAGGDAAAFRDFAETWFGESKVRWRNGTRELNRALLDTHVLPYFGDKAVTTITRADVLSFRAKLGEKLPGPKERFRSPKTINHIMGVLKMVLAEAAVRFEKVDPSVGIKRLKVPRKDIEPFTLNEALRVIDGARKDYRNYYVVRFFTAMRTGELHGLKWRQVDFERRQILVRETFAKGRTEYTKTDGSQREIDMSQVVFDALQDQAKATKNLSEYVFCTRDGKPLDDHNVTRRVWYPLLRHLELRRRRPYETRHTCATLWLAAGENPEWIARQMGHTTTEMLFRVYSRFVPNLTRKDGSAFDRMVSANSKQSAPTSTQVEAPIDA